MLRLMEGAYTTTNVLGEFRIVVSMGDELIIKHSDFETVYYVINSKDRIKVQVEPNNNLNYSLKMSKVNPLQFNSLIDSANHYIKRDAEKSIQFVTEALAISSSIRQNAEVYETLGDVYFQWKQFDLAVSNYRISIQNVNSNAVKLKLAKAFEFNKNYQESIDVYSSIDKAELSNWELTILFEGLGDVYFNTKTFDKSITNYKNGLEVAQKHLITPKVTDLNSKIAQAYDASGELQEAESYFEESMNFASKENKKEPLKKR